MNFFFGHTHDLSNEQASQSQTDWLTKTIFTEYQDRVSTHIEPGFSLTLVNDPKNLCPYQSKSIYVNEDFVCATDCQLFNKNDLAEKLRLGSDASNEELFISAFLKWGDEFPDHFDGKFSFVIWDRKNKTLLAGLDALGYGNFSYSKVNEEFYFSSDLATLLDQPKVDKSVNMKRFYQCFRYSNNTPEQTYFKHCHYCPPSHVLKKTQGNIETVDYWGLTERTPPEKKKDESVYAQEFISILRDAIKKETQGNTQLGLMLSGGYDSSLLAAILSEDQDWKSQLTCYSYTFEKFKSCDESKYIKQTLKKLNLKGTLLNGDDKAILSEINTRLISKDIINMDAYSSLPELLYSVAQKNKKGIMISGLNGDDIFGGVSYMFADLIRKGEYRAIFKSIFISDNMLRQVSKFLNFGIRPLLPNWLKSLYRHFKKPDNSPNEFSIRSEDVNSVESEKLITKCKLFHHQKLVKLIYYRNIPESLHFLRKRMYLKYDLEHLMPYYNKNMIEFMWNIPTQFLEKNGKYRGVQINAINSYGLEEITNRLEKTNFVELINYGIVENKKTIKKIAHSSLLIRDSMISGKDIKKLVDQIDTRKDFFAVIYFVLTEIWWERAKIPSDSFNTPYKQ